MHVDISPRSLLQSARDEIYANDHDDDKLVRAMQAVYIHAVNHASQRTDVETVFLDVCRSLVLKQNDATRDRQQLGESAVVG